MRKLLVSAGMILLSVLCFASPLTVEEAIEKAKNYDSDYALAMKQYADAVAITNRESSFTPSLALTGSLGTGAGFFTKDGGDPTWSGLTGSVGISTSFTFTGSSLNEKKSKNISNESSLLTLENAEDSLESSVISGYFSIAQARDSIELQKASLEQYREQLANVKERYDAGLATELELVQAENQVSIQEYSLESYETSHSLLITSFENLTGLDVTDIELIDVSEFETENLLPYEEMFNRYAYSSPSIKALDLAARSAELGYDTTKKGYRVPTLSLSAGYTISGGYQVPSVYGKNDSISDSLSVTAAVSVPLSSYLPSSSAAADVATAKNAAQDARTQLANTLVTFKNNLESTCENLDLLALQISNQEKTLAAYEKQYALTEEAYYAGLETFTNFQSAENAVLSAKTTLLNLKYTYLQSMYSLALNLGVSYTDLLEG